MIDAVTSLKAVRTVFLTATLTLVLGAGVFVLWDASDGGSVDGIPLSAGDVHAPAESDGADRMSPMVVPMPAAPVENAVGPDPVLRDSDDGLWSDGDVIDTGPFIDADDDTANYASGPVYDVGDFLDPDAG